MTAPGAYGVGRAREEVAAACRRLAALGVVPGTAGNVSLRTGDLLAVTATGLVLAQATPDDVTVVDREGRVVAGVLAPTSELALHLAVTARPEAAAVVHTHAPASTALGTLVTELPPVHYAVVQLGGSVRVAPYATFGSQELADGVAAALDGRRGALMAHHGAVTCAGGLDEAVQLAEVLEWACDVYLRAAAAGRPRLLTDEQLADVGRTVQRLGYGRPRTAGPAQPPEG